MHMCICMLLCVHTVYMCAVYKCVWSISNICDVYMPVFNVMCIWTCDYKVCVCVFVCFVCVYVLYVCVYVWYASGICAYVNCLYMCFVYGGHRNVY